MKNKLLVTGGSGKLARKVIDILIETKHIDPKQLITTTRSPEKLKDLTEKGVEVRQADFNQVESLENAFKGADRLLLTSTSEIGSRVAQHTNAIKAAENAGLQRVIYTSMPNADRSAISFAPEHAETEKALKSSSLKSWTILRNNWYFENYLEMQADIFKTGIWMTAAGSGKIAQISREDLALAAATALLSDSPENQVITLSGPESLTVDQMAEQIEKVVGKKIQVVHVSNEDYRQKLISLQIPQEFVNVLGSFEQHNHDNMSDFSSAEFEALTGVQPKSFNLWLNDNKGQISEI